MHKRWGSMPLTPSRQNLSILNRSDSGPASETLRGVYILWQRVEKPEAILLRTGSGVPIALAAAHAQGRNAVPGRMAISDKFRLMLQLPHQLIGDRFLEKKRFVFIDGHSLAYRAYYALPASLATASGQVTNAVYGFTAMLIKVLQQLKPDALLVAFDKGRATFRVAKYAEYKANRLDMPEDLRPQFDLIKGILDALGVGYLESEGHEADDILATLARQVEEHGDDAWIVTSDRDALQLVNSHIRVLANRRGLTDTIVYDTQTVRERFGIAPTQIADYLALKGDTSDNIPGVPGIGEKTASALVQQFGSVEDLLSRTDEVKSEKLRSLVSQHAERIRLSKQLATLNYEVPLGLDLRQAELLPWRPEAVREAFNALEFRKLYERLSALYPELFQEAAPAPDAIRWQDFTGDVVEVGSDAEVKRFRDEAACEGKLSFYLRADGEGFTDGRALALACRARGGVFHWNLEESQGRTLVKDALAGFTRVDGVAVNRAKQAEVLLAKYDISLPESTFDPELASYLLNSSPLGNDLSSLSSRYLDLCLEECEPAQRRLALGESYLDAERDAFSAAIVERLTAPLTEQLKINGLEGLFRDVEMPLQRVLALMEMRGVALDTEALKVLSDEMQVRIRDLQKEIFELAGEEFNLGSPRQVGAILFEKLRLPRPRKTKTGYTTDAATLLRLKEEHPIVPRLLEHRELAKLKGTYLDTLPALINPATGRVHTTFNQTVTATGRLSSSNPNLQNIPVRTELGRRIRRAFIPSAEGWSMMVADYSQIELRILAHLSGDEELERAFREGRDIHAVTAAEIFGLAPGDIKAEHRRKAKIINFGIVYGMSPHGLAAQLSISTEEAEGYIRAYFERYPGVRDYRSEQVLEATRKGYVTTLLGRRREIGELASGQGRMRILGERLAQNTPIQGTAADMIKVAMVNIQRRLEADNVQAHMLLQVHDELVFEFAPQESQRLRDVVVAEMAGALRLDVPVEVDVGVGPNWNDAK